MKVPVLTVVHCPCWVLKMNDSAPDGQLVLVYIVTQCSKLSLSTWC